MAGTLMWAPAAVAQDPTPSPPTALSATETGGVAIHKKDSAGDVLAGATFTLFDSAGQQVGTGITDADGQLAFKDLASGVYRLKEVSSGSPLHDVVDDQDVIVTPGTDAPLTIIDPFKPATVTLKAKAKASKSGKPLPGSTVNIGTGGEVVLTLTTGSNGTASAKLPVNSRTGTAFWVKQTKAPEGYDLYKPSRAFTAKPGAPVTVTVTNAKTASTTPTPTATQTPSGKPTQDTSGQGDSTVSSAPSTADSTSDTTIANKPAASTPATTPEGTLAHTGADAAPWLIGGAGMLLASGVGVVVATCRRRAEAGALDN
ncbi:collagen binding domain-containing protein [Streptomyces sp. NPDC002888]|uniref:MSCRAMM family protein n=1 Tax=Streptomyces sp. NPDC002888 TaxID=3364668 RepID=UPI0036AE091A